MLRTTRGLALMLCMLLTFMAFPGFSLAEDTDSSDSADATEETTSDESTDEGESSEAADSTVTIDDSENTLDLSAKSYVLMDAVSGQVVTAYNAHAVRPPASMTKLMTLLLAVEAIEDGTVGADDIVTISATAANIGGSSALLEYKNQIPLHELMCAMAVESANDAAYAVAEYIGHGSESDFVTMMNLRAQELGMTDTNYENCNGLPDDRHVSSAYDCALLGLEAIKHPALLEITSMTSGEITETKFKYETTNELLGNYEGMDGLKTGHTTPAGYCLTASAKRGEIRLISAVMGCPNSQDHFNDTKTLLDYGFEHRGYKTFFGAGESCGTMNVLKGLVDTVNVVTDEAVAMTYETDAEENLSYMLTVPQDKEAPINAGDKLGLLTLYSSGEQLKTYDVFAAETVPRTNFVQQFKKMLAAVFSL